jgi:hypothetical protein
VLTEEILDEIGARLEHLPHRSLTRLAQQAQVSTRGAWRTIRELNILKDNVGPVLN